MHLATLRELFGVIAQGLVDSYVTKPGIANWPLQDRTDDSSIDKVETSLE